MQIRELQPNCAVLIQGITGREGSRMAKWMIDGGANVAAGTSPGKGGELVHGIPVFNTVKEAKMEFPEIQAVSVVVPARFLLDAVREALDANISFVHVLTEFVPVHDAALLRRVAIQKGATILGPGSVGCLVQPSIRIGYIGGEKPFEKIPAGNISVVSTSGGMVNELMMALVREGYGIHSACSTGGSSLPLCTLGEAVKDVTGDPNVETCIIFVEPGNAWIGEIRAQKIRPLKHSVVFLPGDALEDLPKGISYGHTGTFIDHETSLSGIRQELRSLGWVCVATFDEFIESIRRKQPTL